MSPKTKFQHQVVRLGKSLPEIEDESKRQAEKKLFPAFYMIQRNRNYCLNCGHKWNEDFSAWAQDIVGMDCPSCNAKNMERVTNYKPHKTFSEYWAIIDVIDDVQVIRMIETKVWLHKQREARYSHREVMQHFINEKGQYESRQTLTHSMGFYYDQWVSGDIELRSKSESYYFRLEVEPKWIKPGRKTLPIIRRNGYKGYFYGVPPATFFINILTEPRLETLLKAKQKALFRFFANSKFRRYASRYKLDTYWPQIRIAMRNNYIIKDAVDWLDMIRMLEYLGKDIHNPEFICPDNYHKAEQAVTKKYRAVIKEEQRKEAAEKALKRENEYLEHKKKYFDITFSKGCVEIVTARSVKEVIELGNKLHHCLGSSHALSKNSLILGAYVDGEPIEAIEYNLGRGEIQQARGLQNKQSKYHDLIIEAVESNKQLIQAA